MRGQRGLGSEPLSADGLGEDDEVAVGVSQPDLALPGVGVDVNVELDLRLQFAGAADRRVNCSTSNQTATPFPTGTRGSASAPW
jgi:hypothetical protein